MDAHGWRIALMVVVGTSPYLYSANYRTANFLVTADSKSLAREIGDTAEQLRSQLALEWLGHELPRWTQPCPIRANVNPNLGAGGATSFLFNSVPRRFGRPTVGGRQPRTFASSQPVGWDMTLQGSRERVLDSVLPHEITHTIFATHFGQPLPRWADEGACTTVEHPSERKKQERLLYEFLTTGRGIAFNRMFAMTEYPQDILPLYSQGYSLARFLLQQGGRRKFVDYVGEGLKTNDWPAATRKHYEFQDLSDLQLTWLDWVRAGNPKPTAKPEATAATQLAHAQAPQPHSGDQPSGGFMFASHASASNGLPQPEPAKAASTDSWYARRRDQRNVQRQNTRDASRTNGYLQEQTTSDLRDRKGAATQRSNVSPSSSRPIREQLQPARIEWGQPSPRPTRYIASPSPSRRH